MALTTATNCTSPVATTKWAGADSDPYDRAEQLAGVAENFDSHDHTSGKCLGVGRVQTSAVPDAAGEVRVNSELWQWYGTSLHTAVDLDTTQAITGAKQFNAKTYVGSGNSNANLTLGLTIQQGANDDEILSLKSSDVAHGMTGLTETDTYAYFRKADAAAGGLDMTGARDDATGGAIMMNGVLGGAADTTRSTAARGATEATGAIKSGVGITSVGANGNVFVVRNYTSAVALVDAEGDLHLDATSNINAWDDHDDLALLETYRVVTANPVNFRRQFTRNITKHAQVLHDTGVITMNDDGHHFVSIKGILGLTIDALRQVGARLAAVEERVALLPGGTV